MVKPLIYASCDQGYRQAFAGAFVNSARAHGHDPQVFYFTEPAETKAQRAWHTMTRFRMLPHLLKTHPAVLALDVDSTVRHPIEIEPEYDMGIFLRPEKKEEHKRVAAFIFYCTDRAMEFAQVLERKMRNAEAWWGIDQLILWQTYQEMGHRYNVKLFNRDFIDWYPGTDPIIYTAKGHAKTSQMFHDELVRWQKPAQDLGRVA